MLLGRRCGGSDVNIVSERANTADGQERLSDLRENNLIFQAVAKGYGETCVRR